MLSESLNSLSSSFLAFMPSFPPFLPYCTDWAIRIMSNSSHDSRQPAFFFYFIRTFSLLSVIMVVLAFCRLFYKLRKFSCLYVSEKFNYELVLHFVGCIFLHKLIHFFSYLAVIMVDCID